MEDWNEASEIRHLLKDVLPGHWKRRVEDEEKKRAKKRVAVWIMTSEDTHAGIMEFFWRNLGEPSRMLGLKNTVYVEVFGDAMGTQRAADDAGHLRPHAPGRDREVHHGGAEAQRQERGPRAGSTGPWTSRSSGRSPTPRGPGGARTPPHPQPLGSGPRQPAQRAGSRGWESAPPRTPHTQAGGAPPGRPRAAPTARKASSQERAPWGW